jgi:2,4-dienoyl-CoA reductase-like NADH-dependent reductase (Old Yellow Enzyme family)
MATTTHTASAALQPLRVGAIMLANRLPMSAMTRNRAFPTNVAHDIMQEYYRQRAAGGASLIVSEGILVSQQGYVTVV